MYMVRSINLLLNFHVVITSTTECETTTDGEVRGAKQVPNVLVDITNFPERYSSKSGEREAHQNLQPSPGFGKSLLELIGESTMQMKTPANAKQLEVRHSGIRHPRSNIRGLSRQARH